MFFFKVNLNYFLHINYYDLLNKYLYKNFYIIPKLNKLSLKIFLKGALNTKFFKNYIRNFLLLYFFCYNFSYTQIILTRIKNRKLKKFKIKLFLNYSIMKKGILLSVFNLFFIFNKYIRPLFFSTHNFIFSKFSGKLIYFNIKIIVFLPYISLFDSLEKQKLFFLKKSKIFLTFVLKNYVSLNNYNFFKSKILINKAYLKNFLLFWCFV